MPLDSPYQGCTVLYVDDEPQNLLLFKAAFRRYYHIEVASGGEEALAILSEQKVHLIITDQKMPHMEGVELLEKVLVEYPSTIRMIMSAYSDVRTTIDAINNCKIFNFITKPWDINELKNIIDHALESYLLKEENLNLLAEKNRLTLKSEKQEKDNIIAQFKILKNQVNPHFLFNCMNTLISMLRDHPPGREFVSRLSRVYRYVLSFKDQTSVELQEELQFIEDYVYLQKIRYGHSLNFKIEVGKNFLDYNLPPLALQLLIENAIKHNIVSAANPLTIELFVDDEEYLVVKNNYQKRKDIIPSTGIGQKNIMDRYRFLSKKLPVFLIENSHYLARIPLL